MCLSFTLLFLFPLLPVLCPEPLLPCGQRQGKHYLRLRQPRSLALCQNTLLPQVMSPSSVTTSTTRRLLKSSSRRNPATKKRRPRTCVTWNSTRPSGKRYLHHCSFRSEENQRTEDKRITIMKKVCCQLSHFAHTQERGDVHELSSLSSCREKTQVAKWKTKQPGFSLKDKMSKFSLIFRAKIQKHEFQADSDRRSIQELNGIIESQRREIDHTLAGDEQLRRDQLLLHEQLSEQNRDLREAHMQSPNEKEEMRRFQGSRFDEFSRRRLIENQDTIHELTARIQELQNEGNCLNDSRDFKDAESVRSGPSHVPSQPALLPLFCDPGGMLRFSVGMLSRNDKPPDIWDMHGISGKRFCKSTGVFFSTLSWRIQSVDFQRVGTHIIACNE